MSRDPIRILILLCLLSFDPLLAETTDDPEPLSAPDWVQSVTVQSSSSEDGGYRWNIVSATRPLRVGPPKPGLRDYATVDETSLHSIVASSDRSTNSSDRGPLADSNFRKNDAGEDVPAFWESVAPATYTIEFATPFTLHQIDLTPPLREIGFSDFRTSVRSGDDPHYHEVVIEEATTARGPSLEAGYQWKFRVRPQPVWGVRFEFKRGTLQYPDRIFLKDLDLWGE